MVVLTAGLLVLVSAESFIASEAEFEVCANKRKTRKWSPDHLSLPGCMLVAWTKKNLV